MNLYILSDSNGTIRGITTSLKEKERIEDEYTELWNYEEQYGIKNSRNSNLSCDTYNLGD